MQIENIQSEYNILQDKIENSSKKFLALHSFLNEDIHCIDQFNRARHNFCQLFYEYENETIEVLSMIKSFFEMTLSVIEDNQTLLAQEDEYKEQVKCLKDAVNELNEQGDITNSQIKYYKTQLIEKDNYIYELREKIARLQTQYRYQSPSQSPSQLDKSSLNLSYKAYDEVTLPKRIIRKASEERLYERPNSSMHLNLNLSGMTDINDEGGRLQYETHANYGYDYKRSDSCLQKMEQSSRMKGDTNANETCDKANKGTITKRVRDVIMNLYKNESTVNHLESAFGNDLIQKISSGNITPEMLDKVESVVNSKNKAVIQKDNDIQEEAKKYLSQTKAKSSGWGSSKGYTKIKGK